MDQSANHILLRGSQPSAADRMLDLLARTVQDHVSDSRSPAIALEGIRKHVNQVLPGLQAACDMITRAKEMLQVQAAHERLERLDERLGDTDDKIGTVDNKLGALDAKLTGTDGKVGALANRIDRLDDRIGDTDDRIGLINERIASIDDRIASIDDRMGSVDALAEALLQPARRIPGQRRKGELS